MKKGNLERRYAQCMIHSLLIQRSGAPRQPWGAPEATLEIHPDLVEGLEGIQAGQNIWVLT